MLTESFDPDTEAHQGCRHGGLAPVGSNSPWAVLGCRPEIGGPIGGLGRDGEPDLLGSTQILRVEIHYNTSHDKLKTFVFISS